MKTDKKYERLAIDPGLHAEVKIAAVRAGVSMKTFAERALLVAMEGDGLSPVIGGYLAGKVTAFEAMQQIIACQAHLPDPSQRRGDGALERMHDLTDEIPRRPGG